MGVVWGEDNLLLSGEPSFLDCSRSDTISVRVSYWILEDFYKGHVIVAIFRSISLLRDGNVDEEVFYRKLYLLACGGIRMTVWRSEWLLVGIPKPIVFRATNSPSYCNRCDNNCAKGCMAFFRTLGGNDLNRTKQEKAWAHISGEIDLWGNVCIRLQICV